MVVFAVGKDVVVTVGGRRGGGGQVHVRSDPVAYLAPFGVAAGWGVGVG